jgi:hypothetical protein
VLCGWFGAQDKHLAKYAELVNGLGCHTLRAQMPPATVFSLLCARTHNTQTQHARFPAILPLTPASRSHATPKQPRAAPRLRREAALLPRAHARPPHTPR